jgi:amino acid adenylation domain-containing protein
MINYFDNSQPQATDSEQQVADKNFSDVEEHKLLIEWNETASNYPQKCIHELFEVAVEQSPDSIAVISESEQLTYRELNARANQLSHFLQKKGVKSEVLVGICLERSIEMIVGLLGILKAGGAYVPIDPTYPSERLNFILEDSRVPIVLTKEYLAKKLLLNASHLVYFDKDREEITQQSKENPSSGVMPDNLAYVIYTSGSTGKPKGVLIQHRSLVNYITAASAEYEIEKPDRLLQFSSISFDVSAEEIYACLSVGATLVLRNDSMLASVKAFLQKCQDWRISILILPTAYWHELIAKLGTEMLALPPLLRLVVIGGEKAIAARLLDWYKYVDSGVRLVNAYGPTEVTISALMCDLTRVDETALQEVPIGRPIRNIQAYVLSENQELCSIGEIGELYLGGVGLSRGYLNRPDLTAEKFISNPFSDLPEARLYKTGDKVRYSNNGNIEFLGRYDGQVKIRGFRIELGEIEAILNLHPAVQEAIVIDQEHIPGQKRLVAYLVARQQNKQIEFWPSVGEYPLYDKLLYHSMTNDLPRNQRYQRAISAVVRNKVVVEIGTGQDAILARFCLEAGAKKVYAIEANEQAYHSALALINRLGLSEKITLICGYSTSIELPEHVDVCVSEIIGTIGGSEGVVPILNDARRFLKEDGCMIPHRSVTRIAAVSLPQQLQENLGFSEVPAHYVTQVFDHVGNSFDLRLCLKNFPSTNIISNSAVFEDLVFTAPTNSEYSINIYLTIEKSSKLDGFLLWLNLYTEPDTLIDILEQEYSWLPVYFPVFYPGVEVQCGDVIEATCMGRLSDNNINPDYRLEGRLIGQDGKITSFAFDSFHHRQPTHRSQFYDLLFSFKEIKRTKSSCRLSVLDIRAFMSSHLPEYMIPSAFVTLPSLPLTPNGKIDRRALPVPELHPEREESFIAPRTPTEEILVRIWSEVLKVNQVGIYNNFLELGGHSLLAIQVISRVRDTLGVELPLRCLFDAPTVAELVQYVETVGQQSFKSLLPPIQPVERTQSLPLSFGQEQLWILHQLVEEVPVYNEPATIRLPENVNVAALEKALNELVKRHEILRTTYQMVDGQPKQTIAPSLTIPLSIVDLRDLPISERETEALRLATEEARLPFNLASGPLLRTTLMQLDETDYRLFLTTHHIIDDGISSYSIFLPELKILHQSFCTNQLSPLKELPIQYADFAVWQRQSMQAEVLEPQIAYWKQQLANLPVLQLPTDRPRTSRQSFKGSRQCLALSKCLTEDLKALSQRENVTLFMTLLAAFKTLLYRYTGAADIPVGTVTGSRNLSEVEGLLGFFLNTLVLRTDLSANPNFLELLDRVRKVTLEADAHRDLPFEYLVQTLQVERSLSQNPLFQVSFVLEPPMPILDSGWNMSQLDVDTGTSKFDLTLELDERPEGIIGRIEYSTDLFDAETIARMIGHFQTLLESIVANPSQQIAELPLITQAEQHQLLIEWNNTRTEYPQGKCIHQLFEEQVERSPDAVAVVFEAQQLTYRELNQRANQLAHYLQTLGVVPEVLVGICVERSLDMIIGILGILKAGGAYVPLDSAYPKERLAYMLSDSQVRVLLTQSGLLNTLPTHQQVICLDTDWERVSQQNKQNPASGVESSNLAYVIYTSGSTGQPKGTMILHQGVVNYLAWCTQAYEVAMGSGSPVQSSLAFDATVTSLFSPLITGGQVTLIPEKQEIESLAAVVLRSASNFSLIKLTPAHLDVLNQLLPAQEMREQTRALVIGGEALLSKSLTFWKQFAPDTKLINEYGPTETVVGCCVYEVTDRTSLSGAVLIGRPINNTQLYILDRHLQPVPVGVSGELHIGGDGLARGYLNRPELTAEKFIPNPFSDKPGSRLYKTGDLARYLPDGNIEFLGRIDHQVKIRGFRIELGEIEAVLSQHPGVQEAVVTVREDLPGDKRLVAYFVVRQVTVSSRELRDFLRRQLPEYMVPAAFMRLDALPLTPNGKIDRRALPAPEFHPELELSFVAPRTPFEELLASIWSAVLNIEQIGADDNFFELGGHSLLATQVISRVNDTWSIELPLRNLFEASTIAALAKRIEDAIKCEQHTQTLPLLPTSRSTRIPLSFAQQRLWFLDQLYTDSAFYNIPIALCLSGQLNIAALEASLNEIICRHEILRTNLKTVEGQPVQIISPTLNLNLQRIDLLHLAQNAQNPEVQQLISQFAERPFSLEQEPLIRTALLELSETEHVFVFLVHHIVFDGWSVGILVRELEKLYTAFCADEPQTLAELPIQYADFASWQQQWLQGAVKESQLSYWKKQLENSSVLIELPTDRPRPTTQTFRGASQSFTISPELSEALASLSRRSGTTLFMTLLAAFQTLLYRYTGQDDVCVGTPIANRNHPQIEELIGFFVNTLVLRSDLSGNPSFEQLLSQVREVALDAYAHQDLPFEDLVEALQPTRSLSHTPLFQVMFALQNAPASSWHLPDLTVHELTVDMKTAKFDLTLSMERTSYGLIGMLEYNTDLFDDKTIARMIGHFQTLLESIVAHPNQKISELPLLTETEQHQLLVEWNNTKTEYPQDKCIHQLFEEQVERTPDGVAIVFEDQQLTYQDLNARANQLAHYLQTLGVDSEVLVGICVERSLEMIVGILGILKAGGAYVPLDPAHPSERLAFMLEDAAVAVLLTQSQLAKRLPAYPTQRVYLDQDWKDIAQQSQENLIQDTKAGNLAYVIYTSGSTGTPKGVLVEHQGVVNLVCWHQEAFAISPTDRTTQLAGFAFDASVWEIWSCLTVGASLYIANEQIRLSPLQLQAWLIANNITVSFLPTALAEAILPLDWARDVTLRVLLTGGDKLQCYPTSSIPFKVVNNYGPTENTVVTTSGLVPANGHTNTSPCIGKTIANTQLYILDCHFQTVPVGVPGELHIGGDGLARGYLNRPDLTQEKFIPNPFSNEDGSRLYKTGDLARYSPDGNIEFLGRIDHQVKIRGFRIELGEIETALTQHPDVREAVVTVREDMPGDKRLVAYITSTLIPDRLPYQSECLLELDGNTLKLRTEDLSNSGIGLVDMPAMAELTPVRLHLLLPVANEAQWFNGTVAWSRSSSAGIQLHLTPTEQSLFDQSITHLLETQGLWKTWQRTIAQSLRQHLKNKLPDYMVPSAFVLMQTLPLTPNGKIDRHALPAPDRAYNQQEDQFVAPRTPTEISVAAIWMQVLGLQQVGIHDNFFELGGHSLLAVQIISRIRAAFAIELPLSHLFESPTIAGLSQSIESAQENQIGDRAKTLPIISPVPRNTSIPLSFPQYDMWYAEQHYAGECVGNSPLALKLIGTLSPAILEQSLNEIMHRHEILRTAFPTLEGQPIQEIAPALTVPLQVLDLQNLPFTTREPEAQEILNQVMSHRFDLTVAPLVKTVLIQISEQEHWLLILMHHIITDGWSYGVLLQELESLYSAFSADEPSPLPELPFQYADFAIWQRNYFTEEVLAAHMTYWQQHLANLPTCLDLLPAAHVPQDNSPAPIHYLALPETLTSAIASFSYDHSATPYMVFLTALNILLYQWSDQTDILVLGTMANRTIPEIEKLLGCFIGDLPLRTQIDPSQTGIALLQQVKQVVSAALTHAIPPEKIWEPFEPFEESIEVLRTANLVLVPATQWSNKTLKCDPLPLTANHGVWNEQFCPLELYVSYPSEADQAIEISASYSTSTFTTETINEFLSSYHAILQKLTVSTETQLSEF